MTPFDFIKLLTKDKSSWKELNEEQRKAFQPFMIHRIFSVHTDLIEFIDDIQKYYATIPAKMYYELYFDILPRSLPWKKYISKNKSKKYNSDLIQFISSHYRISEKDSVDYLKVYHSSNDQINNLKLLLQGYGKTEKEIKQLLK